jgi:hypothetical protein
MSKPTNVRYEFGAHLTEKSWDVLRVTLQYQDRAESPDEFDAIARKPDGTLLKRTSIDPERWEIASTEEDLRFCQYHFHEWDRLSAELSSERKKNASA